MFLILMKWNFSDETQMANRYGSWRKNGAEEKYTLSGNPEEKRTTWEKQA